MTERNFQELLDVLTDTEDGPNDGVGREHRSGVHQICVDEICLHGSQHHGFFPCR